GALRPQAVSVTTTVGGGPGEHVPPPTGAQAGREAGHGRRQWTQRCGPVPPVDSAVPERHRLRPGRPFGPRGRSAGFQYRRYPVSAPAQTDGFGSPPPGRCRQSADLAWSAATSPHYLPAQELPQRSPASGSIERYLQPALYEPVRP